MFRAVFLLFIFVFVLFFPYEHKISEENWKVDFNYKNKKNEKEREKYLNMSKC